MSRNSNSGCGVLIAFVIGVLFLMVVYAVGIGVTGAIWLERPFMYGWHRAWTRWGFTLAVALLLGGGSAANSRR